MAEYWVNADTGSNAGAGSLADPWLTIPGMAGGNAVVAGDIINVANGKTYSGGRLILPANNLTYRGYGLAANILQLTLPSRFDTKTLVTVSVVREAGVHEGMWIIDGTGVTDAGLVNYSNRTGCVVEDVCVINATLSSQAVIIATSTQAGVGGTIRRSKIQNARAGISSYRLATTIEDCLIQDILDDGIAIGTGVTQNYHTGSFVTLRRVSMIDVGTDTGSAIGDCLQVMDSTDGFKGKFEFSNSYISRSSTVKQAVVFGRAAGPMSVDRVYFNGVADGSVQIAYSEIKATAKLSVTRCVFKNGSLPGNPYIRFAATGSENGSELIIDGNLVDAAQHAGLFSLGAAAGTVAGAVRVTNNTVLGAASAALSQSACIGLAVPGGVTLGASATMQVHNNILSGASTVAIRLPTGGANDARWPIKNNTIFGATSAAYVGLAGAGTDLPTVANLQASHSPATGNLSTDPLLSAAHIPSPSSSATRAGTAVPRSRDMRGVLRHPSTPTIGAYEFARLREIA